METSLEGDPIVSEKSRRDGGLPRGTGQEEGGEEEGATMKVVWEPGGMRWSRGRRYSLVGQCGRGLQF